MDSKQQGEGHWTQDGLKELAAQKEEEWRQVQQLRTEALEAALKQKEQVLQEERAKLLKLKEDFKYNLRLLSERDAELDKYDSVFSGLKSQLLHKDAQTSELKIKIDELSSRIEQEVKLREQLQHHYQERIREKQAEMDKYRGDKDAEIQKERNELESFKRNLERQLLELEEELEIQKRELEAEYEDVLRKREHEYRIKADQMNGTVLAHEMKVKLLTKELEMLKSSQAQTVEEFATVESYQQQLEKAVKQKEWEIEDLKAMDGIKISELEGKIRHLESTLKKTDQDYQRKYAEFDRHVKEKEATITKLRQNSQEHENLMRNQLKKLQTELEDAQLKLRQVEWKVQDTEKEKETAVERLTIELQEVKARWELHVSEMSRNNVQRDVELEALREEVGQLKSEISERKEDIERYKCQLADALDRETDLERMKVQLDLEWQRRYESVEREQYEKAENLIKKLTQARDEALSEVKEKQLELNHRQNVIELLTTERDQAMATLKQHGIQIDRNINLSKWQSPPETESERVVMLEEQNEHLRHVIRQMREEMEQLGDTLPQTTSSNLTKPSKKLVANEYVKNLEEELKKMKAKYRQLEQQIKDDTSGSKVNNEVHAKAIEAAGDNMLIKSHIEQLNNTIGKLRSEKVELTTQLRKQQTRLQHLETTLEQAGRHPRELQGKVQQLEYELSSQTRRCDAEAAGLKARIMELEIQLAETRNEADEYHKSNIDQNLEITELRNQLSKLKMELAEGRPTVNFGAQELIIQQLQDEIRHLRQQQKGEESLNDILTFDLNVNQVPGTAVSQLQQKLRTAARHIQQLAKERQQLIDMGNILRAELKKNGIQPPSVPKPAAVEAINQPQKSVQINSGSLLKQKIQNKLHQLEQLQYQITKQELAQSRARRFPEGVQSQPVLLQSSSTQEEVQRKQVLHSDNMSQNLPISGHQKGITSRSSTGLSEYLPSAHMTSSPAREPVSAGLLASISSIGGGESIQEIWKMLDEEGGSPHNTLMHSGGSGPFQGLMFPGDERQQSEPKTATLVLHGEKPVLEPKTSRKTEPKKLSNKAAGKLGAIKVSNKAKVRNYNVKDV